MVGVKEERRSEVAYEKEREERERERHEERGGGREREETEKWNECVYVHVCVLPLASIRAKGRSMFCQGR